MKTLELGLMIAVLLFAGMVAIDIHLWMTNNYWGIFGAIIIALCVWPNYSCFAPEN